jgi:hypothetical protein
MLFSCDGEGDGRHGPLGVDQGLFEELQNADSQQKEPDMETIALTATTREPWNKGKPVGQKTPFKLKEIWAIRVRLQLASRSRDLALFNLAIDSKLRACDLMQPKVRDVCHGRAMASRALVLQQKTQ